MCESERIVELIVDVLRLPLTVDGTHALGDVLVVAATVGDGTLQALTERSDEIVADHRVCPVQGAAPKRRPQCLRVVLAGLRRTGDGSLQQVIGQRIDVRLDVGIDLVHQLIELHDGIVPAEQVEHAVLLVGQYPLELACCRDDQGHQRFVAARERCRDGLRRRFVDRGRRVVDRYCMFRRLVARLRCLAPEPFEDAVDIGPIVGTRRRVVGRTVGAVGPVAEQ